MSHDSSNESSNDSSARVPHNNQSCHRYNDSIMCRWIMSHDSSNDSSNDSSARVPHDNESCHTYEYVGVTHSSNDSSIHDDESCHTYSLVFHYECVMWNNCDITHRHVWHDTHINESCHTYEYVRVTNMGELRRMGHVKCRKKSHSLNYCQTCHTCEWMTRVTGGIERWYGCSNTFLFFPVTYDSFLKKGVVRRSSSHTCGWAAPYRSCQRHEYVSFANLSPYLIIECPVYSTPVTNAEKKCIR